MTIGGKNAAILYVGPGQINAQVPVDVPAGQQAVVVKSVVGTSASFNVTVAATAPAIFFSAAGAAVLKNADFSVVSATNPAKAGDVILVYCTGLGATSASLATGTRGSAHHYRQRHRSGDGDHRRKARDGHLRHRLARFRRPLSGRAHRPRRSDRQQPDRSDAGNGQLQLGLDFGSVTQVQ